MKNDPLNGAWDDLTGTEKLEFWTLLTQNERTYQTWEQLTQEQKSELWQLLDVAQRTSLWPGMPSYDKFWLWTDPVTHDSVEAMRI